MVHGSWLIGMNNEQLTISNYQLPMTDNCWNLIGIAGDRTCAELKAVIHCHNCLVYSAAGRSLLDREAPQGYLDEWTQLLAREKDVGATHQLARVSTISVGIFRLGGEWLALPTKVIKEVMPPATIHTLPHRSNKILLGVVNIRGEIQLCISLQAFLGLDTGNGKRQPISPIVYKRMLVVDKQGSRWVFPVDEIYGIHRFHSDEFRNVPATVSKVPETFTKAVMNWREQSVSYLDDELLFYTLNKKVL
jgi:chemotaxis-related protein WspD